MSVLLMLLGAAMIVAGVIDLDPISVVFGGGCIMVWGLMQKNTYVS